MRYALGMPPSGSGVLFSSATADNAVYCIIGYPSVQYTALHYWIMSFFREV